MSKTIEVTELVKLSVKPDELLIVQLPRDTARETIQSMGQTLQSLNLPFKILVLPDFVRFTVAKAEEASEAPKTCEDCACGKAGVCGE